MWIMEIKQRPKHRKNARKCTEYTPYKDTLSSGSDLSAIRISYNADERDNTMSQYTYELRDNAATLETFEWDNVWWEQANKQDIARVLYIGDSISCATRGIATTSSDGKILFDGFGTSKALDNPFLIDSIRMFAKQQKYRHAILFNNGLHGWHLDDDVQYLYYYEEAVKFLLDEFKDTPIFIVLTTSVSDTERDQRVKHRNKIAANIAAKYGLPVIDLYSTSVKFAEFRAKDGVHYNSDGYRKFAEQIVSALENIDMK